MSKPNEQTAEADVGVAVWFNKREIARVDFKIEHRLSPHNDGWRADATEDGYLRFTMADGGKDVIALREGDYLLSSGEEFYLLLRGDPDKRRARQEKLQRKRGAREAREGTAQRKPPREGGA